jgi:hypothetical protein
VAAPTPRAVGAVVLRTQRHRPRRARPGVAAVRVRRYSRHGDPTWHRRRVWRRSRWVKGAAPRHRCSTGRGASPARCAGRSRRSAAATSRCGNCCASGSVLPRRSCRRS